MWLLNLTEKLLNKEVVDLWSYNYTISPNELYHHGIKGMKWGRRRFTNKDGSLTALGMQRYDKGNGSKAQSHRDNLELKYSKMGMSKAAARKEADKTIKTQRILIAAGALTLTAAAAFAGRKIAHEFVDTTIRSGKTFKRVTKSAIQNMDHNFYATDKALDNLKYRGMYGGGQLGGRGIMDTIFGQIKLDPEDTPKIYNHTLEVTSKIKKASPNSARKVFKDLVDSGQIEGYANLNDKKHLREAYDTFNKGLVGRGKEADAFYRELKKRGYNAIDDVNDRKYSGYNSKNPIIFFGAKDKVKVKNTDTLSKDSLNRDYDKAQKVVVAENIARAMATDKAYVTSAALNGGLTTTAMIYGSRTKSKVNSLHNSGLTNAEIAKRLNIPASSVSKILNKKKK